MQKVAIYLAGSIKKGHENNDGSYWTDDHMNELREILAPVTVSFLNPCFRKDDLTDQHSVFGRDMLQVFCSDLVFVDARDRRGLGVGAEMMWAKVNNIPVMTWAPLGTHYHLENTSVLDCPIEKFVHPFVQALSDQIVESLPEAASWILSELIPKRIQVKGVEHMTTAMRHYRQTQFHLDTPMQELFSGHPSLEARACEGCLL